MLRRFPALLRVAVVGCLALAGFWCANTAIGSGSGVQTLPITIPSLPVTITVPTLPAPPPPPGLPRPPAPIPPLPPAPPHSVPALPTGPLGQTPRSAPEARGTGSTASRGHSYSAGTSGHRAAPVRLTRFRASRARTVRGRGRRKATAISFWLTAPARVVFLVQGPAPGCGTVATFAFRGHRGQNHVRFTGKLGRRQLRPGTYRISPVRIRGSRPARRPIIGVAVISRGSVPAKRVEPCPRGTATNNQSATAAIGAGTPAGGKPGASAASGGRSDSRPKKHGGVLRAFKPPHVNLPAIPRPSLPGSADSPPWLLSIAALLLLVLSGGAIVAYLLNFLRRSNTA